MTSNKTNLKKRFRRNLHLVFPGYDQVFKNVFTRSSKEILSQSPTTDDILEMGEAKLFELMKKASKNQIDKEKARELIAKAEDTITSGFLKESSLFELQIMLELIENIEKHTDSLEKWICAIWENVKDKHYKKLIRIIWSVEKNKKPFQIPSNLQSS